MASLSSQTSVNDKLSVILPDSSCSSADDPSTDLSSETVNNGFSKDLIPKNISVSVKTNPVDSMLNEESEEMEEGPRFTKES